MDQIPDKLLNNGVALLVLVAVGFVVYKLIFSPPKTWLEKIDGYFKLRSDESTSRSDQARSLSDVANSLKGIATAINTTTEMTSKALDVIQQLSVEVRDDLKQTRLLVRTVVDRNERQDSEIDDLRQRVNEYAATKH